MEVITLAIRPKDSCDDAKLQAALDELTKEDPTVSVLKDDKDILGDTILGGTSEPHLEEVCKKIKNEYYIPINIGKPQAVIRIQVPIMQVDVTVPEEYAVTVIADLNARGGKMEEFNKTTIRCRLSMTKLFGYAEDLRQLTDSQGVFSMKFIEFNSK